MNACNYVQKEVVETLIEYSKFLPTLLKTTLGYYFYGLSNVSGLLIVPRTDGRIPSPIRPSAANFALQSPVGRPRGNSHFPTQFWS